jgi:hypothetical protein
MNDVAQCCDAWRKAQQSGTDNEGYGPLLYRSRDGDAWRIGDGLQAVYFCPWCGEEKDE